MTWQDPSEVLLAWAVSLSVPPLLVANAADTEIFIPASGQELTASNIGVEIHF